MGENSSAETPDQVMKPHETKSRSYDSHSEIPRNEFSSSSPGDHCYELQGAGRASHGRKSILRRKWTAIQEKITAWCYHHMMALCEATWCHNIISVAQNPDFCLFLSLISKTSDKWISWLLKSRFSSTDTHKSSCGVSRLIRQILGPPILSQDLIGTFCDIQW